MVTWEVLDAGCDDETRQAGDLGSLTSLYEVVKLAYLQPDQQLCQLPGVHASAAWGKVALGIDSTVFVFGESCSTLLMQHNLAAAIALLVWLPTGDFLIVVDKKGGMACLSVATQKLLMVKQLPVKSEVVVGGGYQVGDDGVLAVTLVTSAGHVFRLEHIDVEALSDCIQSGNMEELKLLDAQMAFSVSAVDVVEAKVKSASCMMNSSGVWCAEEKGVLWWGPSSLHHPAQPTTFILSHLPSCSRVFPVCDDRYIVVLDGEGRLLVVCGETGQTLWQSSEGGAPVLDITLLPGDEKHTQFLLLLRDPDCEGFMMRIVSFPEFTTIYELQIDCNTTLVNTGEGAETILFLEPETSDGKQEILNLKLKSIVDGVPEARLAKLLMKRKFKEAEEFCSRFSLDVEEVHKGRARYLCELLNPWCSTPANNTLSDTTTKPSLAKELLNTLAKIQDSEFVTSLCIEAPLPDLVTTKMLLDYAKERLANTTKSEEGDQLTSLMQRVSESLYRLRTFLTIFPSSDIQHWLAFSHTDMLDEFMEHLSRGNLDVAATVWHRHQYEFSKQVDEALVMQILASVPHTLSSALLCNWLPKNVLPDLVKFCPSSIDDIATWGNSIVKNLEGLEKQDWPSNGLALANIILSTLESTSADVYGGSSMEMKVAMKLGHRDGHSPASAVHQLRQTALALHDLQLLASQFKVKVDFSEYTQENKSLVVGALLDCLVYGSEVQPLMDGFLRGYMTRHSLDQDVTLASYLKDCLTSTNQDWWAWQEALWEDKLYAVIQVMSNSQIKAECILECLKVAPVPWSEGSQAACELGLTLKTSLSPQLEDQRDIVGLKLVLRRYDLKFTNLKDPLLGEMMLRSILSHDSAGVVDDAVCVLATHKHLGLVDIYVFRATHLIRTRQLDEVKMLLLGLNDKLQKQVCQKLMLYICQTLRYSPRGPKGQENHIAVTEGATALEPILRRWHRTTGLASDHHMFDLIRNLHMLQVHYMMFPTLNEMEDVHSCRRLLECQCVEWYQKCVQHPGGSEEENVGSQSSIPRDSVRDKGSEGKVQRGVGYLHHLATLLAVPRGDFLSMLASLAAKNRKLEESVQLCRELLSDPTVNDCSKVVSEVVQLVAEQQQVQLNTTHEVLPLNSSSLGERSASIRFRHDLLTVVHELVCSVLTSTHPDLLKPLLELARWCQLGQALYSQCHIEGVFTQSDSTESSNPYTKWKFSPMFLDSSMPIEENFVTAMLSTALNTCLASHSLTTYTSHVPYLGSQQPDSAEENRMTCNILDLISHLRDRGQDLLALSLSLHEMEQHEHSKDAQDTASPKVVFLPTWQQVFTILLKVMGSPRPDITLAVGLLLLLTKKDALKVTNELIKRFGYEYNRLKCIGTVGWDYCSLNKLLEVREQFNSLMVSADWGKRLSEMSISFKEAFKGDKLALIKVRSELLTRPDCSFSLLYEYCQCFSLDVVDSLLCYLQTTLQSWSPEVSSCQDQAPPQVEPPKELLAKCQAIIAELGERLELKELLHKELQAVNSYNYELIELMLQQLIMLESDGDTCATLKSSLDLMSFLRTYQRQAPPGEDEVDNWIQIHPQSLGPPHIAKYRLPFCGLYSKSKIMKIVEKEIYISTLNMWLQIANVLKLQADYMCLLATQNTVSKYLESGSQRTDGSGSTVFYDSPGNKCGVWQVCSMHSALLVEVQQCISRMKDFKLATGCAMWVVNRLPPGADRVKAAHMSRILAEVWQQGGEEAAVQVYEKMKEWHKQLGVEHSLHKFGLAQPQYLALVRTPLQLVTALYLHPALDSQTSGIHTVPDINGCVTDICAIAGCNKVAIQFSLLEKWLPPSECCEGESDDTVSNFKLVLDPSTPHQDQTSHTSLARVIYLLGCYPRDEAVAYLLKLALNDDTSISATYRLRVLHCILTIADEATIQKYSSKGLSYIRSLLQTTRYISRLETLGHATTAKQFNSMDKGALVEGLWRSQRHNPQALYLITDLCHDYKVTTASLWGAILTQLTNFVKSGAVEMVELERVLLQVKGSPHLWLLPALTTAWQTVLLHPFTKASVPVSEESLQKCLHSVDLLLRHCPVVVSLQSLLHHCATLNLPLLAITIAAADQLETHDLQVMVEPAAVVQLKSLYHKLKPTFAFPKRVEDLMEELE